MFLHQKLDYSAALITDKDIPTVQKQFQSSAPTILGVDTETTGLDIMTDLPFLVSFGFDKYVYAFEPSDALNAMLLGFMRSVTKVFAHNAQFDYHMFQNLGYTLDGVPFADSMAVARLTQYADSMSRLSLESVGTEYVDDDAKFGGKVIRSRKAMLNRVQKQRLKELFGVKYKGAPFTKIFDAYQARVYGVASEYDEYFDFIAEHYSEATYYSVYLEHPALMINYAMDDVVIMLEFLKKALPVLDLTDPGHRTFERECRLLPHSCAMERVGFKVDVDYLLQSRKRVILYKEHLYKELHDLTVQKFTIGQHDFIKKLFNERYSIMLYSADEKNLDNVVRNSKNPQAVRVADLIIKLRTVDKWLSTYIDGKLNAIGLNRRLYTSINNQGAVSGRVSSNLQQQPKDPLLTEDGEELFHPRKVFIADPGHTLAFIDFSQMELRVQAYYTLLVGEGDTNLCRAYIPFKCHSRITGEQFDPRNPDLLDRWDSGEWLLNGTDEHWQPVDLHDITTFNAFPHLNHDRSHPEFKKLRKLGKMCNFLKNYQGGKSAIIEQLGVSEQIAEQLDQAYYKSFPNIKDYQNWVSRELTLHGFIENLYGRRYYMQDSKWYYKAGNYEIQGSCADLVKEKEIEVCEFLAKNGYNTKFVLPIHDELVFLVPNDELHVIEKIRDIMQDNQDVIKWIPMLSEIEVTTTNWADKAPMKGAYK